MMVNAADSLERLVNRERLFVWLRFSVLLLVGAYFVIDPRPQLVSLSLTLNVFVAAALANIPRDRVPDMPDRIIAATALYLGVPLVTRDAMIRAAPITTIW